MNNKLKEFCNILGVDTFCRYMKTKLTAKTIQMLVFAILVVAFTFNHYRFTKSCVEWKKGASPFADVFGDGISEINICTKYGLWPDGITAKSGHTHRIPADLIFLFVGAGIIYFTKDLKHK